MKLCSRPENYGPERPGGYLLHRRIFVNRMRLLFCTHGRDLCSMNGLAGYVHEIETNDPTEARRSRYAQYRGQVATLKFGPATVRGMVRSVKEDSSCIPVRWLVTIVSQ